MQIIDSTELQIPTHVRDALVQGETVVVSDGTHPIAFLVSAKSSATPRPFGLCKGEFEVPDDFNAPSPEIEPLFYGGMLD